MTTTPVRQDKDKDAELDYVFNWQAFVDADSDSISTSNVIAPSGITAYSTTVTASTVRIFVSGGTEGTTYPIINRIVTTGGRTEDKVLQLTITQEPSASHSFVVETGSASSTANSYCSVANADTYHASHLYATTWNQATDSQKEKALMMATRLLDEQVIWSGLKRERGQALQWPRFDVYDRGGYLIDSDTIPQKLIDATAELARFLLDSDRTAEEDTIGFKSIAVGSIRLEVDKTDRDINSAIIPKHVWDMLHPIGRGRGSFMQVVRT